MILRPQNCEDAEREPADAPGEQLQADDQGQPAVGEVEIFLPSHLWFIVC